ncbi:MAG: hypothetical protein GY789_29575 [Hyphomicrobiales bacterium]|nr:hypothetical protein [Hyphomicrobiales bacterium]MCP5001030.1 hypothetical protein [Hyphomicrobiales bacterium]
MTFPIFTTLISWIWFGEQPSRRAIIAALVVLVASMLVLGPSAIEPDHLSDLILALSAPLSFRFMLNVLTRQLTPMPPLARIASLASGAVIGPIPLVAWNELGLMLPKSGVDWWLLIGMALATFLLPQLLYASFAPAIGPARTSMASSIELPTNFAVAWLAFEQIIGFVHWFACVLIIGAIVMTPARNPQNSDDAGSKTVI